MDLQQLVSQMGGLGPIAAQLGISESQASSGIDALLPMVLGGFQKSAQGSGGAPDLGSLLAMVQGAGGAGLIDNVMGSQPTDVAAGNGILGQIFGSKDVSRAVADRASGQSGIDPAILKKLLPIVAMLVAGYMARSGGGNADAAGAAADGGAGAGGLGGLLGSVLGGGGAGGLGGLGALLDGNGDGNPLDDIIGMAGKFAGR